MKKILALVLAVLMVLSLVACGGNKPAEDAPKADTKTDETKKTDNSAEKPVAEPTASGKDTLTIALPSDRGTLNPMNLIGFDTEVAIQMIYEPLWDKDSAGTMVFRLAESLDQSDPCKWIIKLKQGIKFTNGNEFTADDVVFTLERGNNRDGEADYLPNLDLANTKALDTYTVQLGLTEYDMSYVTSMCYMPMMDKESYDHDAIAQTPIGTGPYVLKEYVVNSHLTLERNEAYWGEAPYFKYLNFVIIAEDSQRTNAVATGEVDISDVPFADITYVQGLNGYDVKLEGTAMSTAMYYNTSDKSILCNNEKGRQAIAMAIDTEAIADLVYSGFATPAELPVSVGNVDVKDSYCNLGVYGNRYNVEKAKALAEEAGLIGQHLVIITPGSAEYAMVAEIIADNLKDIGIDLEVKNYDAGSAMEVYNDPTMYDLNISFTTVPSKTIAQNYSAWVMYANGGIYCWSEWPGRDRYLELCEGIMAVSDPADLDRRYQEMTEIHVEGLPWYNLVDIMGATAINSHIQGYEKYVSGIYYAELSWAE